MKNNLTRSLIVIIVFLFSFYARHFLHKYLDISFESSYLKILYIYIWWLVFPILTLGFLYGFKNIFTEIGLDKGFFTGFLFAAITVSPMLISSAVIGTVNHELKPAEFIHNTVAAGFMEEYFFRGFLFGILFRKLNWGFIPAAILGAVIFGLGHIYQGSTIQESIMAFLVTAMGAIWFAWLYIEWNSNLWIPVFLHTFMNLSWILFQVSPNAIGGTYTNLFRALTIALTIFITIRYHKKHGLIINKSNLLINS